LFGAIITSFYRGGAGNLGFILSFEKRHRAGSGKEAENKNGVYRIVIIFIKGKDTTEGSV